MANINIDYDSTVSKGNQIKEISNNMLTILAKLKGLENDIQLNWKGEASKQYIDECEKLVHYLTKLDLKIAEFGDTVIKIANIIKEADESTASTASGLTTGN